MSTDASGSGITHYTKRKQAIHTSTGIYGDEAVTIRRNSMEIYLPFLKKSVFFLSQKHERLVPQCSIW